MISEMYKVEKDIYLENKFNKYIKNYGLEKPKLVWDSIKTVEELFYINKRFINGDISQSIYHFGPLENDSKELKKELIELHNLLIFTHDGQNNLIKKGFIEEEWINPYNPEEICGNHYYEIQQKAYISCFIPNIYIDKLINNIIKFNRYSDDQIGFCIFNSKGKSTNFRTDDFVNLTKERSSKIKEDLENNKFLKNTNFDLSINFNDHFTDTFHNLKNKNIIKIFKKYFSPMYIMIDNVSTKYNLPKLLIDLLKKN